VEEAFHREGVAPAMGKMRTQTEKRPPAARQGSPQEGNGFRDSELQISSMRLADDARASPPAVNSGPRDRPTRLVADAVTDVREHVVHVRANRREDDEAPSVDLLNSDDLRAGRIDRRMVTADGYLAALEHGGG